MSDEKKNQREIQQKYLELQLINARSKQIEEHLMILDKQVIELMGIDQGLSELERVKINTKMLIPIANGLFVDGKIENNSDVLVNVGSNVVVRKSMKDAKELMKKQIVELQNYFKAMESELGSISERGSIIQRELIKLSEGQS